MKRLTKAYIDQRIDCDETLMDLARAQNEFDWWPVKDDPATIRTVCFPEIVHRDFKRGRDGYPVIDGSMHDRLNTP